MKRRTRRINHTQRRRIERSRVRLTVAVENNVVVISADVDLDGLRLESDARVFLDLSRKAQSDRIDLGTVGHLVPAREVRTPFKDPVGLRYDVVVVGSDDALLLAAARRIPPEKTEAQESLLAIRPAADLGERLWRLDVSDQPVLEVNARIMRWRELAENQLFQSLVLPEVVGQVLTHIAEQGAVDLEDSDDALAGWWGFFESLGVDIDAVLGAEDLDIRRGQVDQAVDAFTSTHSFASRLIASSEWGGDE